jgi:phytoene dehydrogenase-like protein
LEERVPSERRVVIVGAGINGLVAANYLRRSGCRVLLLERRSKVGGACVSASVQCRGREVAYASGASVLGMMQDFVLNETGLADRVEIFTPDCPEIVYFKDEPVPVLFHPTIERLRDELRQKCGERGDVEGFDRDLGQVADFLRKGFRNAAPPTLALAQEALGCELAALWISGDARSLLDHYFTSERVKTFFAISVTESGPTSLDDPFSAFTVPLMASGGVFDGKWGFVKGGIWKLTEALAQLNRALGVEIVVDAEVMSVSASELMATFSVGSQVRQARADALVFATDPLSAAALLHDKELTRTIGGKRLLGTSGKLAMIFDQPVEWRDDEGSQDFPSGFRFIMLRDDLNSFEKSAQAAREVDFDPGFLEIYPEGPAMQRLGAKGDAHIISVFFKNLGWGKRGAELPDVENQVAEWVLARIKNRAALMKTILHTPKDLSETFGFPRGNIDHIELARGQTFFDRNYSANPERGFYRFGAHESIFYCGAGAYPCGSVAGTAGYMCAQQILKAWV